MSQRYIVIAHDGMDAADWQILPNIEQAEHTMNIMFDRDKYPLVFIREVGKIVAERRSM
jgi:hypothetical protein